MENEIARIDSGNLPMTKEAVLSQKTLVRQVMESVMKDNTHYGIIPGCKQPSLYKAGSEVILSTFRIAVVPTVEDLSTRDCFRYRVTCQGILPSGEIVGAGIGECSTDEEKYKWRSAVVSAEYEATAEDRRRIKYSRPSQYNKEGITQQVRTNPADLSNTVLKMAKKRAQIDLTLTCTACSDVFVQDLEDLSEELRDELVGNQDKKEGGKPHVDPPQEKKYSPPVNQPSDGKLATDGQVKMLYVKLKNAGISKESFCAHYGISDIKELPFAQVNPAFKLIESGDIAEVAKTEPKKAEEAMPGRCVECGGAISGEFCTNPECVGYRSDEDL